MLRTRIKICGITRPEDGQYAAMLGVDAIGLVFYEASPRNVSIAQAEAIVAALPAFVTTVGLFMDAEAGKVRQVLSALRLDTLQFHGNETPVYCESFGVNYIKSVAMLDNPDVAAYTADFPGASGFLLDAVKTGEAGGSGDQFNWQQVPTQSDKPLILAGGLSPENVANAIRQAPCYGVDVSSGVEASKGIKSQAKIRAFIEQVMSVK